MSFARDRRPAGALQLGVEEAQIERGIVDDQLGIAEKGNEIVRLVGEQRFVLEEFAR